MSAFWIVVSSSAGTQYGEIRTAQGWDSDSPLDRAGKFSFSMPASDPKAALIVAKRIVTCYTIINNAVTEIGSGVIDKIGLKVDTKGNPTGMLDIGGDNRLRELTYRQVGSLVIDDGAGGPDVTGPADIIALAPAPWALDTVNGYSTTFKPVLHAFEGELVLNAFVRLVELTGEHLRVGAGQKVIWMREQGSAKLTHSGITGAFVVGETVTGGTSGATGELGEATAGYLYVRDVTGSFVVGESVTGAGASCTLTVVVNPSSGVRALGSVDPTAIQGATDRCIITDLTEEADSYDQCSRVYPFGAGEGAARVKIDAGTFWAGAAGYTMDTTYGYISNNAAEAVEQIDRYKSFKDIQDDDMLAETAYEWLKRHSSEEKFYRLTLAGLNTILIPGQTLRVVHHRWVDGYHAVNVDADLVILTVTSRVDNSGFRTVGMSCGTVDRHPENNDTAALLPNLTQSNNFYTHPQPLDAGDLNTAPAPGAHAATHAAAGVDAVTLTVAQISDLMSVSGAELTIATGAISVGGKQIEFHIVDTEGDAASDDLDTINGGAIGDLLFIKPANTARTVVVKDATGNLQLAGDFTMDNALDTMMLLCVGGNWLELSRSDNGT